LSERGVASLQKRERALKKEGGSQKKLKQTKLSGNGTKKQIPPAGECGSVTHREQDIEFKLRRGKRGLTHDKGTRTG